MSEVNNKKEEVKFSEDHQSMKLIRELSSLLDTGLDDISLKIIVELIELGVDPEALVKVVIQLKNQKAQREKAARQNT